MWLELLLWLLAVQAAGWAVLPAALQLFRLLPDRGYGLSKPLGLLAIAYLIWAGGMLGYLEYRRATVLVLLGLLALGCWTRWGPEARAWLARGWRVAATEEAIFLAAGLLALGVRVYNADIDGQEKFMDLAFFHGFLASTRLPAEDTWLAGYGMPYYPFGYLLFSVPTRLSGLPAVYGYNLALVLVFALVVLGSASLAANVYALLRGGYGSTAAPLPGSAWPWGLLGAAFVALCGNLEAPLELLAARGFGSPSFWAFIGVKHLQAAPNPTGWLPSDGGWWWRASRVIPTIQPDGITEFPYFSFLLGDLHPHFMALPMLLLTVGLALTLLLEEEQRMEPLRIAGSALILGAPIVTNTWDVATSWALYGGCSALAALRVGHRQDRSVWRAARWQILPLPLALLLFSPYFVGYASQPLGIALTTERTPPISLLVIFGPFLLFSALLCTRLLTLDDARAPGRTGILLAAGGLAALLAFAGYATAALCALLLGLALAAGLERARAWLAMGGGASAAAVFLTVLVALALAILVAIEIVYLRDSFGTRMNTVFKFSYHVWLLLALAAAPALALWLARTPFGAPSSLGKGVAGSALIAGLLLGLVYPVAATWTKSGGFRGTPTLDGARFLEQAWPDDAAAIAWLRQRSGRPVVLEAVGPDYQEFGRVSVFSGLPTVLGWVGHELQWRGPLEEYSRRERDVDSIYLRTTGPAGLALLDQYRVRYVFFGALERQKYGQQAEERLRQWLVPVFRRPGAVIFAVPPSPSAPQRVLLAPPAPAP